MTTTMTTATMTMMMTNANLLLKLLSSPLSLFHPLRQKLHQQLAGSDHHYDHDDDHHHDRDHDDDNYDDHHHHHDCDDHDNAKYKPDDVHLLSPWLSTRLASKSFLVASSSSSFKVSQSE